MCPVIHTENSIMYWYSDIVPNPTEHIYESYEKCAQLRLLRKYNVVKLSQEAILIEFVIED